MINKRVVILVVLMVLLVIPLVSAFNASTSSYTVDSFHLGSAGNNGSTASYEFRSTTTYQQGSSNSSGTSSYDFVSGWFKEAIQGEYCGNGICGEGETCSSCPEDCGSCASDGGPGGGGGGAACTEKWNCTDWSRCVNGTLIRTCADINKCGTTKNKPNETRSCVVGEEEVIKGEEKAEEKEEKKEEEKEAKKKKPVWIPIVLSAFVATILIVFIILKLHPTELIERLYFKIGFSRHPAKLIISGKK